MERELVYASLENDTAIMRLDKHIGRDSNDTNAPFIDGSLFADEIEYLSSKNKKIIVKINSPGGNVLHGWTILDAITEANADTHCYGLAASMAGMILLSGKKRTIDSHASVMLHGPHSKEESAYVNQVRAGFEKILKAKTSLSKENIEKILNNGDHYYSPNETVSLGIVDEVIPSNKKITPRVNASLHELTQIYASLNTNMETPVWLKTIFGGNTDSENITAAMKIKAELEIEKSKSSKLETEKTVLEARIKSIEDEVKASKSDDAKKKATDLIDKAEKDGKIKVDASQKASMIEAAIKDFATVETMLNSIQPQRVVSVAASIKNDKGEDLSYETLAKDRPEVLAKIAQEQPELFKRLSKDYNEKMKK